jgi:hypothetical protein
VNNAGPGEEFVEGGGDSLVGGRIAVGEEHRRVREARFVGGNPIEIAFAVRSEAKTPVPPLRGQIDSIFLALEIEREKGFDPFGWVLRLCRIFGVGRRTSDFKLFGKDRGLVVVKGEETLREEGSDALLDFGRFGMDEATAKRITGGLELLGSHAIAELMHEAAGTENSNEGYEGDDEGAKDLDEEGLHFLMILQGDTAG